MMTTCLHTLFPHLLAASCTPTERLIKMLRRCCTAACELSRRHRAVRSSAVALLITSRTMQMQGAETTFEGSGDPLTSRLLAEHKQLETLFRQYEQLPADTDPQERLHMGWEMIRQISMHAATEEMVLYPAVAKHLGDDAGDRLVAETQAVKEVLAKLNSTTDPNDPQAPQLIESTIQMTRDHIKDEESTCLPPLTQKLEPNELKHLARQFEAARGAAPTRPHPYAPNKPPWNVPANAAAVPLDMARDAMRFDIKTNLDQRA